VEGSDSCPQGHATAPETGPTGAVGEDGRVPPAGSSSQRPATSILTESSSYHVSTSNHVEVAAALGMPEAKLIGGNIIGSLRFSSSDRERRFLAKAGSSFGFPLMEKCLMASGVSQMLQDVEDLSLKAFVASRCASRQLKIDNERASQLAGVEERVASLEKEKTTLEDALVAARAEVKSHAKAVEAARRDALAAEEAKENAEKAKAEAEKARRVSEDQHAHGKDVVQRWRTAISSFTDLVQADVNGLLAKFAIEPPEISQEENVEVAELFRWIRASLAMARSGADFKCELSATVVACTLSAAVCRLLPAESCSSSTGIVKAQLRLIRDSCFEWPSLDSLRPEVLPVLPKNIAKNFTKYFH